MAILSIELEIDAPERVLIRVRTVDDTLGEDAPVAHTFSASAAALAQLGDWIERWLRDGP